VYKCELLQGVGELGRRVLHAPLQPLHAVLRPLVQAELAVQLNDPEPVERARVQRGRGLAVELDGLGGFSSAAPAILAVPRGVAVLRGEDEERVGSIKILLAPRGADPVRVAVGEEVLRNMARSEDGRTRRSA
jgi:hypothetical protein